MKRRTRIKKANLDHEIRLLSKRVLSECQKATARACAVLLLSAFKSSALISNLPLTRLERSCGPGSPLVATRGAIREVAI
ncbi:MAG: hypothetical protein SGPRY_005381 [Prymnesium sp.]